MTPEITNDIRLNGDQLEGRRNDGKWEPLKAEAPDVLFVPGKPRYRKIIQRDTAHNVTGFVDRREEWDLVWKRLPGDQ